MIEGPETETILMDHTSIGRGSNKSKTKEIHSDLQGQERESA